MHGNTSESDNPMLDEHFGMGVEASTALRFGSMMLTSGAPAYRVIRAVKRCARALGFDYADVIVGLDTLTCTFHRGERFRTLAAVLPVPGVNASRMEALETLSRRDLHHYVTADEVNDMLDDIEHIQTPRWSPLVGALAAGFACGGFTVLNHFSLLTAALVVVAAACGQFVRQRLNKKRFLQLGGVMIAGALSTIVFLLLSLLVPGADTQLSAGFVPAILYLIPGFPLFVALNDLSRFDFSAGIPRLFFALEVIVAMMLTVAVIAMITNAPPPPQISVDPDLAYYVASAIASFFSVGGFAIIFNASRRMALLAASLGTVANILRLALLHADVKFFLACFLGTLTIGLLGWSLGRRFRVPRSTVTIPATVVMIPGTTIYAAMQQMTSGDVTGGVTATTEVVLAVLFLSGGLTVARLMTDGNWAFQRHINFRQKLGGTPS